MALLATTDDIARLEQLIVELHQTISALVAHGNSDAILTFAETAQLLKVTPRTLQRWVASSTIPHFRPSGKAKGDIRFYKSDVLNLISSNTKKQRPGRKPGTVRII